jgi:PAS domain S-box-containing protein
MPHPPQPQPGSDPSGHEFLTDLDVVVWEVDATTMRFITLLGGSDAPGGARPGEEAWGERVHPSDRERIVGAMARVASAGGRFDVAYQERTPEGGWRPIRDIGHAVTDEHGTPLRLRGVTVPAGTPDRGSPPVSEERFRAIVEHLPAIVYLASADPDPDVYGRMLYVSPRIREILGIAPEAWMGDPEAWMVPFDVADRARILAERARVQREGGGFLAEYRMRTADGEVRWIRDTASLVVGDHDPAIWQGIMTDITAERETLARAEEAEERYRTLVEQIPAVVYIDPVGAGSTIYISPQAEAMFGYPPQAWYDDPTFWRAIVHPDDQAQLDAQPPIEASTATAYRIIAADGREVWVHDTSSLILDEQGRALAWQGVLVDVTQQRERAALERELEREREEADRLRLEDEMKTTFLQAVSHDLRTPLAAILGLSLTLERRDVDLAEEERHDLANRISQNARKLDRIVADFLDLERLQRGLAEPDLEPVDVGALVRETVANSELVAGRRLALDVAPLTVPADRSMVERIVENLLGNAVKHTPGDSRIWVRVERTDDGVLLSVEDDGPGVPPQEREHIFEAFRQGSAGGSGSGVGLALVARFAELHGGRAWVQDREGGGASFRVVLSWEPGRRTEAQPTGTGSPADNHA